MFREEIHLIEIKSARLHKLQADKKIWSYDRLQCTPEVNMDQLISDLHDNIKYTMIQNCVVTLYIVPQK